MTIKTVTEFKNCLISGAYAWPGGYPLYFITQDGAALSFATAKARVEEITESITGNHDDGWLVVEYTVNWEDDALVCDHTGEIIESAYELNR